ncbi:hypothetical protein [Bosea sp. LjRoot237]|uniref:hypothetical protein n=1 Tax=Bosea sp. LjRoot237 TaxID=3342292 RepID=UPI003ECE647D
MHEFELRSTGPEVPFRAGLAPVVVKLTPGNPIRLALPDFAGMALREGRIRFDPVAFRMQGHGLAFGQSADGTLLLEKRAT